MTDQEPTNSELLALVATIALIGRQVIENTDRSDMHDMAETLDLLHEHLALAGGSVLSVADSLGCRAEIDHIIAEEQDRVNAIRACRGLAGRA